MTSALQEIVSLLIDQRDYLIQASMIGHETSREVIKYWNELFKTSTITDDDLRMDLSIDNGQQLVARLKTCLNQHIDLRTGISNPLTDDDVERYCDLDYLLNLPNMELGTVYDRIGYLRRWESSYSLTSPTQVVRTLYDYYRRGDVYRPCLAMALSELFIVERKWRHEVRLFNNSLTTINSHGESKRKRQEFVKALTDLLLNVPKGLELVVRHDGLLVLERGDMEAGFYISHEDSPISKPVSLRPMGRLLDGPPKQQNQSTTAFVTTEHKCPLCPPECPDIFGPTDAFEGS